MRRFFLFKRSITMMIALMMTTIMMMMVGVLMKTKR